MNIGHNTKANNTYAYIAAVLSAGIPKEIHTMPSIICWIPNKSGILARGSSFLPFAFESVKRPVALSAPPAIKLAVAEKHIIVDIF